MKILSLRSWSLAVGAHLAMLASGCSNDPIRQTSSVPPTVNEMPSQDEFYLKVENLLDNVGGLQVSRITLLAMKGKTLRFHIGTTGTGTRSPGKRTLDDTVDVRRLEVVLVLRLVAVVPPGHSVLSTSSTRKLRALVRYDRDGAGMDTDYDAPNAATLKELVTVSAMSGRYPVGKPVIIGRMRDEDLTAWVE